MRAPAWSGLRGPAELPLKTSELVAVVLVLVVVAAPVAFFVLGAGGAQPLNFGDASPRSLAASSLFS